MNLNNRFIIDTNTLISSVLIPNSITFQALEKARNKGVIIFSEETFLEFEVVLFRKKFDRYFTADERLQIIQKVYNEAMVVRYFLN
jgi:putative PIN family toxin of toxin-antitoxin system